MRAGRPAAWLTLALLVCAALAGCAGGGDEEPLTKRAYEQKVRTLYAGIQQAFLATRGVSREELPERIEAAQDEIREAADELDEIEPPENVAFENRELVEGLRADADDLDELLAAAERQDAAAIRRFNESLATNPNVERIAEAAEEMKFKGYNLGPIAEE